MKGGKHMEKNSPRKAPRNTGTETPLAVSRRAAGLTQAQLAELLGVPYRTIQSWELGVRKPPEYVERLILEKLANLCKAGAKISDTNRCPFCGQEMERPEA